MSHVKYHNHIKLPGGIQLQHQFFLWAMVFQGVWGQLNISHGGNKHIDAHGPALESPKEFFAAG